MNWLEQFAEQISFVELILKGIMIGIIVSAPMGPVGVMCIRRTLNKGRWHGFMTGIGASMSDLAYAAVTAFGMSFVFDFINNAHSMFVLQVVGREAEARKLENRTDITLAALWNSMLRSMLRQP